VDAWGQRRLVQRRRWLQRRRWRGHRDPAGEPLGRRGRRVSGLPLVVALVPWVVTSVASFGLPDTHASYGTGKPGNPPARVFSPHILWEKSPQLRPPCLHRPQEYPQAVHSLPHTIWAVVHRLSRGLSTVAFVTAPAASLSFLRCPRSFPRCPRGTV